MIPIGDSTRPRRTPWVNYALILINIAVFIYTLSLSTSIPASPDVAVAEAEQQAREVCYGRLVPPSEQDRFICQWGFQPAEYRDALEDTLVFPEASRAEVLLSLITSLFIHASFLHIVGNLLFLWVFGDNIEDRFGHIPYLLFYLLGGIVATALQSAIDVESLVPVVGASGAIAAVLGAYLLLHPTALVTILLPIFVIPIPVPIPAFILIGLWFVQNLFSGFAEFSGTAAGSGIAFFAHIGGFLFGLLLTPLLRIIIPPPRRRFRR